MLIYEAELSCTDPLRMPLSLACLNSSVWGCVGLGLAVVLGFVLFPNVG